jgi:xylan 1,4-beta-xylosidase
VRETPDVAALASLDSTRLTVLVWHYHDDDVAGPDADVTLALTGLPARAAGARLTHYRIDEHHGNAYAEWKRMGSPIAPNEQLYQRLIEASRLAPMEAPRAASISKGASTLRFTLPRQGVSLLVLDWSGGAK